MDHTIIDSQSASATIKSNGFNVDALPFRAKTLGVHITTSSSYNGTTGTIKIQHSNIDVDANYKDIDNASVTLASGTNNEILTPFVDIGMKYYRAVFTVGNATLGTIEKVVFNFN